MRSKKIKIKQEEYGKKRKARMARMARIRKETEHEQ
jgi:hypothetical protein